MKLSPRHQSHARTSESSGPFGLSPVAAVVLSVFAALGGVQSASVDAAETDTAVQFDTTFLRTDPKQTVDVSRFTRGNMVSPGVYSVDLWVNDVRVARQDGRFVVSG